MSTNIPPTAPLPFFITLSPLSLKAAGLPARSTCYALNEAGKLTITVDGAGRRGILRAEAEKFFSRARPLNECKRSLRANQARREQSASR